MVLVVVTVVLGVAVGYLGGGRVRRLADVALSRVWLLVAAFGAQALLNALTAAGVRTGAAGTALLLASQAALVGFVWANRVLPGIVLIAFGFGLNAAVIVANGGMPVSPKALAALTAEPPAVVVGKHRLLEVGDPLPWLADVIPVPVLRTVVSVGDIVLAIGVAVLVATLMQARGRHVASRRAARREPRDAAAGDAPGRGSG